MMKILQSKRFCRFCRHAWALLIYSLAFSGGIYLYFDLSNRSKIVRERIDGETATVQKIEGLGKVDSPGVIQVQGKLYVVDPLTMPEQLAPPETEPTQNE